MFHIVFHRHASTSLTWCTCYGI